MGTNSNDNIEIEAKDSNDNLKMEAEKQNGIPAVPSPEVVVQKDENMAGIFAGRSSRKGTSSSSSGSSENTPLLNGSQEGPCYAYSYGSREENIVESVSSAVSCEDDEEQKRIFKNFINNIKTAILIGVMIFCVVALSFIQVHQGNWNTIAVTSGKPAIINITQEVQFRSQVLHIWARGPFLPSKYYGLTQDVVTFTTVKRNLNGTIEKQTGTWTILVSPESPKDWADAISVEREWTMEDVQDESESIYQLIITTNKMGGDYVSMAVNVVLRSEVAADQIIMAVCVLVGLYVLIIFDLVHRTLAAMIGATAAIACLALVGERPSLEEVLSWVDVETLSLLFGMMVLVSILCETGFFDYVAVTAYKVARGRTWPLVTSLCLVTAVLSAFLDNVTTVLLMTAVTIRLCEAMNIDPKHMLIALVIFSNIGGAATPIGDPPNLIIIADENIKNGGIDFGKFTLHMFPAVVFCLIGAYILIRLMYRDITSMRFTEPSEVVEIKHEIEVWKKAYNSLSGYSRDEDTVRAILKRKITVLETLLRKKLYDAKISEEDYRASLKELSSTFKVRNKTLLLKSGIVIGIVIIFFFLESIPQLNLSIGWIGILGAICLLILADFDELESVFSRVEWSTLLFFAALFVVMEALSKLKLVLYIVRFTEDIIGGVDDSQRLLVAIILIIWISALASSIIDNIPFTTVMINVVTGLAENEEMNLPLEPLVYALALGTCLGGNGTLIGASANVVTAGLSEQHGYRFTFYDFFKVGFPVMLVTTFISTAYLLICHVVLQWHG